MFTKTCELFGWCCWRSKYILFFRNRSVMVGQYQVKTLNKGPSLDCTLSKNYCGYFIKKCGLNMQKKENLEKFKRLHKTQLWKLSLSSETGDRYGLPLLLFRLVSCPCSFLTRIAFPTYCSYRTQGYHQRVSLS